tara:strand:+ start:60 stop:524 length:465 start_codon:yes stop_codon:yes gene_type:complete
MCKLSDLTRKQANNLAAAMPESDNFDFGNHECFIGFTVYGTAGTWRDGSDPKIVTYAEMMQLLKHEWTIYNNTLPWSDLSDKQKGKMLLAAHNGRSFGGTDKPTFNNQHYPYQAKAVKPEPTMAELFALDIKDSSGFLTKHDITDLIAKGWVKK